MDEDEVGGALIPRVENADWAYASPPAKAEGLVDGVMPRSSSGDYVEPSPAPVVRAMQRQTMRRQFSLELSLGPSLR